MEFNVKYTKKSGNEKFLGVNKDINITDYWSFAHSDLLMNIERGKLAEYIVSIALNSDNSVPQSWDSYDVLTPDGVKIEVKSSAYLQSWYQKNLSSIGFDIAPKKAWSPETNTYETEIKRQSDVYVFCLFANKNPETVNLLNMSQWEFYVLKTSVLNSNMPEQKRVGLSRLLSLGAVKCSFADIKNVVNKAFFEI